MDPITESQVSISKNGRFLLHRTIITHILPTDYYRALLANSIKIDEEQYSDAQIVDLIKKDRERKEKR